ncbi:MAG: leucine-rich repeat domain-containing protein [Bryobacteraceae bacterium]
MPLLLITALLFAIEDGRLIREKGVATAIDLTSTWVTDADMAKLARMPELRRIDLSETRVTDAGLELLKPLQNVGELNCYYAEFLTDDGVRHLRGWKHLERLNLRGTRVTSKVFEHLAQLTSLRWLDLAFTEIDDEGFEHLASLTRLEHLAIGGNRLNGSGLKLLKLLPSLTSLDAGGIQRVDSGLWGLPLTDQNLQRIGELTQLKRLSLAGATLSDRDVDRPGHPEAERRELRDLSALARLVHLEMLDLSRQPVTTDALKALAQLPRLLELRLGLAKTLDDSAAPILRSMKGLRSLYISGSKMAPATAASLVQPRP